MRKNLINIVTVFGLVATIIIQLVWLYHSFVFVRKEVSLQASILLDRALWEETLSRCYSLPPNTLIDGKTEDDIKQFNDKTNLDDFVIEICNNKLSNILYPEDFPLTPDRNGVRWTG